jgi:hypothetical protein
MVKFILIIYFFIGGFTNYLFADEVTVQIKDNSKEQYIDPNFYFERFDLKARIGIVYIENEKHSPASLERLQYDENLKNKYKLQVIKDYHQGKIEFRGTLSLEEWADFFSKIKFIPVKNNEIQNQSSYKFFYFFKMGHHNKSQINKTYNFFVRFVIKEFVFSQLKNVFVKDAITTTMLRNHHLEFTSNQLIKKYKITNHKFGNHDFRTSSLQNNSNNVGYKFNVVDMGCDKNIQTKIAGNKFKLDIVVSQNKNKNFEYYRYTDSIHWYDAKKLCDSHSWGIASKNDLIKIKNIPANEYWTNKEINSKYVYMFRPPNWSQRMEKKNFKKLYCINKKPKFTGQVEVKFLNSDIKPMKVYFHNENRKTITVQSNKAYRNIGIEINYRNKKFYSEDNFSIRPAHFEIKAPKKSVISGTPFDMEINVLNSQNKIVSNYTETNSSNTFAFKYKDLKSGCKTGKINSKTIKINNGRFQGKLIYPEIGKVQFQIKEKVGNEFAKIDANDGSSDKRFITPAKVNIDFKVAKVKITSSLQNNDISYTYVSNDLNRTSAKVSQQVTFLNNQNQVVENFSSKCYASDVNSTIGLSFKNPNGSLTLISNKGDFNITNKFEHKETIFKTKIHKGCFNHKLFFNFKRFANKPLNPISVKLVKSEINAPQLKSVPKIHKIKQFSVSELTKDNLYSVLSGKSNLSIVFKNPPHKNEAKFYFARLVVNDIISRQKRLNIKYNYEIFNSLQKRNQLNKFVFGKSENLFNWYKHLSVNCKKYLKNIKLSTISRANKLKIHDNTIELVDLKTGNHDDYEILVQPPKELIYNRYDENASLTSFNLEFNVPDQEKPIKMMENLGNQFKRRDKIDVIINKNTRVSW